MRNIEPLIEDALPLPIWTGTDREREPWVGRGEDPETGEPYRWIVEYLDERQGEVRQHYDIAFGHTELEAIFEAIQECQAGELGHGILITRRLV